VEGVEGEVAGVGVKLLLLVEKSTLETEGGTLGQLLPRRGGRWTLSADSSSPGNVVEDVDMRSTRGFGRTFSSAVVRRSCTVHVA